MNSLLYSIFHYNQMEFNLNDLIFQNIYKQEVHTS